MYEYISSFNIKGENDKKYQFFANCKHLDENIVLVKSALQRRVAKQLVLIIRIFIIRLRQDLIRECSAWKVFCSSLPSARVRAADMEKVDFCP